MVVLRENEAKTLLTLQKINGRSKVEEIIKKTGLADSAVMRAVLSLKSMGFINVIEQKRTLVFLNNEGREYAKKGLPERQIISALRGRGGEASISEITKDVNLNKEVIAAALGWLNRKGWAKITKKDDKLRLIDSPLKGSDERLLELIYKSGKLLVEDLDKELRKDVATLRRRKIALVQEGTQRELKLTDSGRSVVRHGVRTSEEISQLTPKLISTGQWRSRKLREYNIRAEVPKTWPGKKHPYLRFLDTLKNRLVALGFKEMSGPIVEFSFFNCDALFMPQDHPAREIHDMCLLKSPEYGELDNYVKQLKKVAETHENGWKTGSKGWGYRFSMLEAAKLLLRSHTTATSARTLLNNRLENPGKYFSIARCFRPDVIDKTHLPEFNQVEGIVVGEKLTLRDLLGILKMFALEIADADKVRYSPDYYPFTEPSVELMAYKKNFGWIEFGGSGIFRPEVTLPLGIDVPVLAWGLGVDRLFMMKSGIDDIRFLFSNNLDWIRKSRVS